VSPAKVDKLIEVLFQVWMGPVYDLFDGSQIREGATLGASPAYCKILYQCAFNISTLFDRWQQ